MGPMKHRLTTVETRRALIQQEAHSFRGSSLSERLRDITLDPNTHCTKCCLPLDKHVEHEPPDCPPKPREILSPTDEAYQAWRRAFIGWYQTALGALMDDELRTMPLPVHGLRLWVIAEELKRRINRPRPVSPTAWERIMGDSVV